MIITDVVQESDTTHADSVGNYPGESYGGYSSVGNSAQGWNQTPGDYAEVTGGKPSSGFTFSQVHTFANAQTIRQFVYKVVAYAQLGGVTYDGGIDTEVKVEYYDGSWTEIAQDSDTGGANGSITTTLDASLGGVWTGVTKVRITANARTWHSGGEDDDGTSYGRISDFQAQAYVAEPDAEKSYAGTI